MPIGRVIFTARPISELNHPEHNMTESTFVSYKAAQSVTRAVQTRRSLRAFQREPIAAEIVRNILETAARAPSGTNMQPWQVLVLTGKARSRVCQAVCHAFDTERAEHTGEQPYYPDKWFEPYLSRRRKVGWDLYGLLDIKKGDTEKMHVQHRRNFTFFDAPVGLIFTMHRDLATGSWLDYGMYLQNVMLLAREAGLHTCPQAAWSDYHKVIRRCLPIGDHEMVVCGMALGFADPEPIENTLVTDREPVGEFVHFLEDV